MSNKSHKVLATMIVGSLAGRMSHQQTSNPEIIEKFDGLKKELSKYFKDLDKDDKSQSFPSPEVLIKIIQTLDAKWVEFNLTIDKTIKVKKSFTYCSSFNKSVIKMRKMVWMLEAKIATNPEVKILDYKRPALTEPNISDYLISNFECLGL
jgi:hypothetical protein